MSRSFICGLAISTLYSFSVAEVHAQENCSEKLLTPDITVKISDQRARAYFHSAMCSSDFETFKSSIGVNTGASYFGESGYGNFNQDNYNDRKRSTCADRNQDQAASALSYTSESVISTIRA
jgi:hypothetical protein